MDYPPHLTANRPPHLIGRTPPTTAPVAPATRSGDGRPPDIRTDNPELDLAWSGFTSDGKGIFEYYDYYFTGEDIRIYIDGVEPPNPDANIPVMDFAFKISQQKMPIYGYWSYKYDTMMRGTRVVQGVIRIATTTTNYMTRLISKAAEARARGKADFVIRGLDLDEQQIERYWGRTIEHDKLEERDLFNVHPPFNFVIVYGIENVAACLPASLKVNQFVVDKYNTGWGMMSNDDNHTIIEIDQSDNRMRRVIEQVELLDMQIEYSSNGQVCSEVYSFIARDHFTPQGGGSGGATQNVLSPYIPSASDESSNPGLEPPPYLTPQQ